MYTNFDELPLTLNALQVAQILNISRASAYCLLKSRGFPSIRIGNRLLIGKDKLMGWMDEQAKNASA